MENECMSCHRESGNVVRLFPVEINPEYPRGKICICDTCRNLMSIDYFRLTELASTFVLVKNQQNRLIQARADVIPELVKEIIQQIFAYREVPTYETLVDVLSQIVEPPTGGDWTVTKLYYIMTKAGMNKEELHERSSISERIRKEQLKTALEKFYELNPASYTASTDAQIENADNVSSNEEETLQKPISFLQQMPGWKPEIETINETPQYLRNLVSIGEFNEADKTTPAPTSAQTPTPTKKTTAAKKVTSAPVPEHIDKDEFAEMLSAWEEEKK